MEVYILYIPEYWNIVCNTIKSNLKTRAENVWKNCGGVVDISSATYKDVNHEETLDALKRYCNFLYVNGIDIKTQYKNQEEEEKRRKELDI